MYLGTSFGVSTIYLAAGVRDNSEGERGVVIATEHEPTKIVKAKDWEEAGLTGGSNCWKAMFCRL